MGKTALSKRGARDVRTHNKGADVEVVRALRTVKDQEAFYFYEAVGKPTGELAVNLSDFLDKVKAVKSESLMFHLQRGDFQNWVENTLGDSKLGKQLSKIPRSDDNNARTNVCKAVEDRIDELTEPNLAISIKEEQTIVPIRA